jgi:hypothetical protein
LTAPRVAPSAPCPLCPSHVNGATRQVLRPRRDGPPGRHRDAIGTPSGRHRDATLSTPCDRAPPGLRVPLSTAKYESAQPIRTFHFGVRRSLPFLPRSPNQARLVLRLPALVIALFIAVYSITNRCRSLFRTTESLASDSGHLLLAGSWRRRGWGWGGDGYTRHLRHIL